MAVVDFFSGCGGFSLGAHQAGFDVAAAFDIDPVLTYSYRRNFPGTKLVHLDLADATGDEVRHHAGVPITGIIGGPPCQGFSSIGRRSPDDLRRQLLFHYFRLVAEIRPAFFLMENVLGLQESGNRELLNHCLQLVQSEYHLSGPLPLNAAELGAATARKRVFIAGIRKGEAPSLSEDVLKSGQAAPANVRAAIGDLQVVRPVESINEFDRWKIATTGKPSSYARKLRSRDGIFTGNLRTRHSYEVLRRFSQLRQGELDRIGRYPRLSWNGLCPTLRAGTGNDHGSYQSVRPVHPEADRVITVREAARLQGFPDRHLFHPTIWHSFRMIGNSVSPIVAYHVMRCMAEHMPWLASMAEAAE